VRDTVNPANPALPRTRKLGQFADELKVRKIVAATIRDCPKSCEQVADAMTERIGQPVTASILRDFAATSKHTARFPASLIAAFCEATGDDRLRLELAGPRLRKEIEFAKRELGAVERQREAQRLRDELLAEQPKRAKP